MVDLKLKIRTIPDFPKPGIQFRDITTLLADPQAFNDVVGRFVKRYQDEQIDLVDRNRIARFYHRGTIGFAFGKGLYPCP